VLTVGEHIAIVQRAQAIAATDHRALVQAQRELAKARAEIKRLRRRVRRHAPASSGRRGPRAPAGNGPMTAWQKPTLDAPSKQHARPAKREFIAFRAKALAPEARIIRE
jgi:hypothetical protein